MSIPECTYLCLFVHPSVRREYNTIRYDTIRCVYIHRAMNEQKKKKIYTYIYIYLFQSTYSWNCVNVNVRSCFDILGIHICVFHLVMSEYVECNDQNGKDTVSFHLISLSLSLTLLITKSLSLTRSSSVYLSFYLSLSLHWFMKRYDKEVYTLKSYWIPVACNGQTALTYISLFLCLAFSVAHSP